MKTKIEIKSRWNNKILFDYEKENNTIKDTLQVAVKQGVNFEGANLCGADLEGADLRGANLCGADLRGVNFKDAYLGSANFKGADLRGADLRGANLCGANLCGANLYAINLKDVNLKGTNIKDANIYCADLKDAKEIPYVRLACPSEGSFIGWKKVKLSKEYGCRQFLIKLEIPEDALRSSATTSKCRCSKAKVLEITDIKTGDTIECITNINEKPCVYKVGEIVLPDSFDENRFKECSNGIHFFINKQDAIDY